MAATDPFHEVLARIIDMVTVAMRCDSCFIYVLDADKLVLRASKNPHSDVVDQLEMAMGQGVTGWVAKNRQTVSLPAKAWADPRFAEFVNLPEDQFEAFLSPQSCAAEGWLVLSTCSIASFIIIPDARFA
jgi:signal transduction protein with GAF and PtsI domain